MTTQRHVSERRPGVQQPAVADKPLAPARRLAGLAPLLFGGVLGGLVGDVWTGVSFGLVLALWLAR